MWWSGPIAKGLKAAFKLLFAGLVILVVGFAGFVYAVHRTPSIMPGQADGIVALTGGPDRISQAVQLLAKGHGRRLLISGVNKRTSRKALRKLSGAHARYFDCCVDIGYQALDTIGNADEARKWALKHRFESLIVVTSSFHMPRSLAELARVLPDVSLIAFPVVPPRNSKLARWWSHSDTAQLMLAEYFKLLSAAARFGIARMTGTSGAAALADPAGMPKL